MPIAVRPIVTYVAITWFQKVTQVTTRNTLDKLQRLACVYITGAIQTCPAVALEVILDLTPLHVVVEGLGHAEMYRLTSAATGGDKTLSQRAWSSRVKLYPLLSLPNDEMVRKYCFEKNFLRKLSNKKEWNEESSIYFLKTVGSKTNKGIGAGVSGTGPKYLVSMGRYSSVFEAEIGR
ncbi:hypothetical protein Trydic_g9462 [Trypoxylus dichotomus]